MEESKLVGCNNSTHAMSVPLDDLNLPSALLSCTPSQYPGTPPMLTMNAWKKIYRGRKIIICVAFFSKFCQISTLYSILNLILRFTKEAEVQKLALPFVPAGYIYIRTFDVISEVNCVFLRKKRKFEKIALYPSFDNIAEVNCVLPRRR